MELIIKILVGIVGSYLTYHVISIGVKRILSKETDGKLYFGGFLIGLAIVCSLITAGMFWVLFFTNHRGQEIAIFSLIAMFGLSAIYCWAECVWTKGFFNDEGMVFQSLWGGRRYYEWHQLIDVKFNENLYWYVLSFKNEKSVRLSIYLHGHGELFEKLEAMGHDF